MSKKNSFFFIFVILLFFATLVKAAPASAAIDKAISGYPVASGGGILADIGCFEYGAIPWAVFDGAGWAINGVPDFEPLFTVATSKPTVSWDFLDMDVADKQHAFEIEIDKVNTTCAYAHRMTLIANSLAPGPTQRSPLKFNRIGHYLLT